MLEKLIASSKAYPEKIALIDGDKFVTYAELCRDIFAIMRAFPKDDLPDAGIIYINARNMASAWPLILALRSLGHTTVHVPDITIMYDLALAGVAAVFHEVNGSEEADFLASRFPGLPAYPIASLLFSENARETPPPGLEHGPFGGHIEYTSGSTGKYKAFLREGGVMQESNARAVREFRIDADTVFHLGPLPASGVGNKVPLACWQMGATCIFDQRPNWMARLHEHQPKRIFKIPQMMQQLTQLPPSVTPSPTLQVYCGGGFLAPGVAREVAAALHCKVYLNYAATEMGVRLQNEVLTEEDTIWLQPIPQADLEIVDEQDNPAKDGEEGILPGKLQPCDPKAYLNSAEATQRHFRNEYFYPGDLAIRRADGRIRILGRDADVINLGGRKRGVEPLEEKAREILGVPKLCLYSRQSDKGENYMVVVIEGTRRPDVAAMQALAREYITKFAWVELHLLPAFPYQSGGMGKLRRSEILRLIDKTTLMMRFWPKVDDRPA